MLWLCLHLPRLALEVRTRALRRGEGPPLAVADPTKGRVVAADGRARARGVRSGMRLAAARALCAGLRILPRDPAAEADALARVAAWAGRFSDRVGLAPPRDVLLEAGGSLRLFGGPEGMQSRVAAGLAALGYTARLAAAPTPLAARWLARANPGAWIPERPAECLGKALDALPLGVPLPELPAEAREAARRWGLRTLGELRRLPRHALAGRGVPVTVLDRAWGRHPDPVPPFRPPACYRGGLAMPAPCVEAGALAFALRRLLAELEGWLVARDGAVDRLLLRLRHPGRRPPETRLHLTLTTPRRDAGNLLDLLRERLETARLPAPVDSLVLESGPVRAAGPVTPDLLAAGRASAGPPADLVDELAARLGRGALSALAPADDHRPERAWRRRPPRDPGREAAGAAPAAPAPPRPLWLLPRPRPLPARRGLPCLPGELRLIEGPERIETGWWDGRPVARDYYVAETADGARWWIFRERRGTRGWFLHGLFA